MDIKVRELETFQLPITVDDTSAETVLFSVYDDSGVVKEELANFVDGEATIEFLVEMGVGDYSWVLTVTYSDGVIDILPDPSECDGDCEDPAFEVCPGVPTEESS